MSGTTSSKYIPATCHGQVNMFKQLVRENNGSKNSISTGAEMFKWTKTHSFFLQDPELTDNKFLL